MTNSPSQRGVPVSWQELIVASLDSLPELLERVRGVPQEAAEIEPPWLVADVFGGPSIVLSQAAVVLGPEACAPFLSLLAPFLPQALSEIGDTIDDETAKPALYLLAYVNVARCCGALAPGDGEVERRWLPPIAQLADTLSERDRFSLAFGAVAAGLPALVPDFIGGGPLPRSIEPGKSFGFNVPGFVRYLAAAETTGGTAADVLPAWTEFLDNFPRKLASNALEWFDLMWAARAFHARIEGEPDETVAEWLHRAVT